MNIMEVMPLLGDPRGTEPFEWQCWGDECQYLDWGGAENHIASTVFDRQTGLIYCLELFTGSAAVRYLEPDFAQAFREECTTREVNPDWVTESLPWTDTENPQTILALLATLKGDLEL
jgi:hypothetical protein